MENPELTEFYFNHVKPNYPEIRIESISLDDNGEVTGLITTTGEYIPVFGTALKLLENVVGEISD